MITAILVLVLSVSGARARNRFGTIHHNEFCGLMFFVVRKVSGFDGAHHSARARARENRAFFWTAHVR